VQELTGLVELLQKAGPWAVAALFIAAWWLERKDHQVTRAQLKEVYDKVIAIAVQTGVAVESMEGAVHVLTDTVARSSGPRGER
jgi:hypothetical protein